MCVCGFIREANGENNATKASSCCWWVIIKRNQAFVNSVGEGRRHATVALRMESEKCRFCDFKPQEIER